MKCETLPLAIARAVSCVVMWLITASAVGQNPNRWSVAFSCDSSFVGACGVRVTIHDFKSGKTIREVEAERARRMAFSPVQPDLFAVADEVNTLRLYRVNDEDSVQVFKGHDGYIGSVAFDKSGRYVASTSSRGDPNDPQLGQLRVWEIETGKLAHSMDVNDGKINGLSFSDDGKLAALCRSRMNESCHLEVYQVPDWTKVASVRISAGKNLEVTPHGRARPDGTVTRFTPDKKHVLVAGGICVRADAKGYGYACKPTMMLWRVDLDDSSSHRLVVDAKRPHCFTIGLSPDGKRVVCGNGPIDMRDPFSGKLIWRKSGCRGVAISPDGKFVAAGRIEGVLVLNAETGKHVRLINDQPPAQVQSPTHQKRAPQNE